MTRRPEAVWRAMALSFASLSCGHAGSPVLRDLCGTLSGGDCVALTGDNGSGKSTLLRTLAGELPALAGQVASGGLRTGLLHQSLALNPEAPVRASEVAAMGLWPDLGPWRRATAGQRERVRDALLTVGLGALAQAPVRGLSQGQLQRLALARLIVTEPDILLLDEPLAALDEAGRTRVLELVAGWAAQGRIVIISLHDRDLARQMPRHLHLGGGTGSWIRHDPREPRALRVIPGGAAASAGGRGRGPGRAADAPGDDRAEPDQGAA